MGGCKHTPIPVGTTYGRLTILDQPPRQIGKGNYQYFCQCSCGNSGWFYAYKLKSGHTKSCGCLRIESTIERNITRSKQ